MIVRLSFIGHYVYMCDMDYCRADREADDRKIGELSIFSVGETGFGHETATARNGTGPRP